MGGQSPPPPCSIVPPALFPHEEVVLCFRSRPLTTIDLDTKPALSENIRKLEPPGGHKCIIGLHKLCFDEISSLLDFELKISWKIILSQQILKPWLFSRSINSNPFLQKSLICAFNYGSFWDLFWNKSLLRFQPFFGSSLVKFFVKLHRIEC